MFECNGVSGEMSHVMVHVHVFLLDIIGTTAINRRHISEMGSNKCSTVQENRAQHGISSACSTRNDIEQTRSITCSIFADLAIFMTL